MPHLSAPTVIDCPVEGCGYRTDGASEAVAVALLSAHALSHRNTPPAVGAAVLDPTPRGPKLDRLEVNVGVSVEEWNMFMRRWEVFRIGSGIDNAQAPAVSVRRVRTW